MRLSLAIHLVTLTSNETASHIIYHMDLQFLVYTQITENNGTNKTDSLNYSKIITKLYLHTTDGIRWLLRNLAHDSSSWSVNSAGTMSRLG